MVQNTLVDTFEGVVKALATEIAQHVERITPQVGERPFGAVKLNPQDQALRYLPEWYALGQAPAHPNPYWEARLTQQGPKDTFAFDSHMRDLFQRMPLAAIQGMNPSLADQYGQLRASGIHPGGTQTPAAEAPPEVLQSMSQTGGMPND